MLYGDCHFIFEWQIGVFWFCLSFIVCFTAFLGGVFWGVRLWARARTQNTRYNWDSAGLVPDRRDIWRAIVWYLWLDGKKGEREDVR